ncbi:MAG: DUF5658 family protein [Candidatus Altiarchaeota archaeon]|nr:DUF5658 family protein [Candidatus Altiarchaeota archaeon]
MLFDTDVMDNAVVLFFLSALDAVSTYFCIEAGFYEANPLIRFFYDSIFPGMTVHLVLYWFIALFVAYLSKRMSGVSKRLGVAILLIYAAKSCFLAFNNFAILIGSMP